MKGIKEPRLTHYLNPLLVMEFVEFMYARGVCAAYLASVVNTALRVVKYLDATNLLTARDRLHLAEHLNWLDRLSSQVGAFPSISRLATHHPDELEELEEIEGELRSSNIPV